MVNRTCPNKYSIPRWRLLIILKTFHPTRNLNYIHALVLNTIIISRRLIPSKLLPFNSNNNIRMHNRNIDWKANINKSRINNINMCQINLKKIPETAKMSAERNNTINDNF